MLMEMVSVKSLFINREIRSNLDNCDEALDILRAWQTENCKFREQKIYASEKFGAQKKPLSSFGLVRWERDGKEKCGLKQRYCCLSY